jgi:hypothetical protein
MDIFSTAIGFIAASAIFIWKPTWAAVIAAGLKSAVKWIGEKISVPRE